VLLAAACIAGAARADTAAREPVARVMVSLKAESATLRARALSAGNSGETVAQVASLRAARLSAGAGVPLAAGRVFGPRAMVVRASGIDSAALAARLSVHPDVEYAAPDRRVRWRAVVNDPLFDAGPAGGQGPAVGQWYLRAPDDTIRSAVNAQGAWNIATGKDSVVVAVLDTGVLADHLDLAGRVLPGIDLIDDTVTANDGDGRDADATDAGDWVSAEDVANGIVDRGCGIDDSSWHGTAVSGIIAAAANNGIGMAGVAHGTRILPVRVLGKCGGFDSDILAGIYWAAGVDQPGLPGSTVRARVINLSLGGEGSCSRFYREAVQTVGAAPFHAVLVAAAGNSTGHAVSSPANCAGVIGVTGLRHAGSKVGFSDLGPQITIAAPGGNCINIEPGTPCLYPILTTSNSGTTVPLAGGSIWTDSFKISVGTSFATPIVAGAVALMLSARPELTPAQVIATIRATARPFPASGADNGTDPTPVPMCRAPDGTDQLQCYCSVGLCGAGMLDVAAAVLAASRLVTPVGAADQLFEFAERSLPAAFPGPVPTQTSGPFHFRHYPGTGYLLGVVVHSDATWLIDGVYVMGGGFGSTPRFVGLVADFVTLRTPLAAPAGATAR